MGRMLLIHAVVLALLVAGCSSRPTEVRQDDSQSTARHKTGERKKPGEAVVAEPGPTPTSEVKQDPAPPKKENWFQIVRRKGHEALTGTGQVSRDVAIAVAIGATVGLVIAIVFVAGAT